MGRVVDDAVNLGLMLVPVLTFSYFLLSGCLMMAIIGMVMTLVLTTMLAKRLNGRKVDPSNKLVMITGCDSGFGEAVAKRLHGLGYTVVAVCYNKETAPIRSEVGSCFHILEADVRRDADLVRLRDECTAICEKKDLRFWALLNNAGVAHLAWVEMFPMDKFEDLWNVNYFAPLRLTQLMLPLVRKGCGRVVNTCSSTAYLNSQKICAYSSSKEALLYATHLLDKEIDSFNCRAIAVTPWMYRTNLFMDKALDIFETSCWRGAPLDVQSAYGGDEALAAQLLNRKNNVDNFCTEDKEPALKCFIAAVHSHNPRSQYNPGPVKNQVAAWLLINLPAYYSEMVLTSMIKSPSQ